MAVLKNTRILRMAPWAALAIMPVLILVAGFDSRSGFLRLNFFWGGSLFHINFRMCFVDEPKCENVKN